MIERYRAQTATLRQELKEIKGKIQSGDLGEFEQKEAEEEESPSTAKRAPSEASLRAP